MKIWLLVTALFIGLSAQAETKTLFKGRLNADQHAPHQAAISGELSLLFDQTQMVAVHIKLDAKVFGKTELTSSEQYFYTLQRADQQKQISAVYKYKGAPHKWYFVTVWNESPTEPGKFEGLVYGVAQSKEEIEAVLRSGVVLEAQQTPEMWKSVGTSTISLVN